MENLSLQASTATVVNKQLNGPFYTIQTLNASVALCAFRAARKRNKPRASKMLRKISKWRLCCWFQVTLFQAFFVFSVRCSSLYVKTHYTSTRSKCVVEDACSAPRRTMRLMPVFRRDGLRDALTDTLKIFALVRPDA